MSGYGCGYNNKYDPTAYIDNGTCYITLWCCCTNLWGFWWGYSIKYLSNGWSISTTSGDGWRFFGDPGYNANTRDNKPAGTFAVDFSSTDVGVVMQMVDIDMSIINPST